jgi:hypothetical protein
MATAKEIRHAVRKAVEQAIKDEPADKGLRARIFVACLQGWLDDDKEIVAELERLRFPGGRSMEVGHGNR